ncbi:hypothetical protein TNCV_2006991 [Trichonephila clavipes]|nr:hypothetical protein TNCV_2006991 [Trichonephila clavipes]
MKPSGRVVAFCASTSQVWSSYPGLIKVDSAFHPISGSINECPPCLGTKHWGGVGGSRQTNHLTGISVHAPQGPRSRIPSWAQ